MKKIALILAVSAIAAPAFAGSMHGADWGNLISAAIAPPPVVVVQPQPVYVAPPPAYALIQTGFMSNGLRFCTYANGETVYTGYGCPAYR